MSLFDGLLEGTKPPETIPIRPSWFRDSPGYFEPAKLWLYGNVRLLQCPLAFVPSIAGKYHFFTEELVTIEKEAEKLVLGCKVLVCGVHNEAHIRTALVPLRWGSPRIVVFSGGFLHHLGENLITERLESARLWRQQWDPAVDLAVSRRDLEKKPTRGYDNPTVDRLIRQVAERTHPNLFSLCDLLSFMDMQ